METLVESDLYRQSIKLLSRYEDKRPDPKRKYDQFTVTLKTTARRVALLDFLGDMRNKQVLFLGDDDFTSVATANIKSAKNVMSLPISPSSPASNKTYPLPPFPTITPCLSTIQARTNPTPLMYRIRYIFDIDF